MDAFDLTDSITRIDTCSKTLLTIVARGNAIITELLRLVDLVPAPFKYDKTQDLHSSKDRNKSHFESIIHDFSYFKDCDKIEALIERDDLLRRTDEELCDKFGDIFTRFYLTFESIHRYASDLNQFVLELEEDPLVGQSLDVLIGDTEGLQLLCEAYFLLGYMLIATDNNFEGGLRERLIVCYYRYSSYRSSPDSSFDDTCNLMRTTGFKAPSQIQYRRPTDARFFNRPSDYPESYLSRVSVNKSLINLLISKLQSVDIYNQTAVAFPHPDHRSTALSQQASILYLILYFCPEILKLQRSRMREITDKFFPDNWVISVHMGEVVNLFESWAPYKAASDSLIQSLDLSAAKLLAVQVDARFKRASKQTLDYLKDGFLNEESILDGHTKILNHIRDANVVLRWILLQSQMHTCWTQKHSSTINSVVIENLASSGEIFLFLQNLAELEDRFSMLYDDLLRDKCKRMDESKQRASEVLRDLVSILQDPKSNRWLRLGANTNLAKLIEAAVANLGSIETTKPLNTKELVIKLINSIESAMSTYSDGKSLHVVQLFTDAKKNLLQILQYLSLNDRMKILLQTIADFSYAWKILNVSFTNHMQQSIKDDPLRIGGLKATFLKLASSFDAQLIRIQQMNSQADLISVSQYYSTKLVAHIRDVLQIVPTTILDLVASIVELRASSATSSMPSRISLDSLRDYIAPEERFQLIELTFKISHYSQAVMLMENTNIGLVRIKARQLLEGGIRRALAQRISNSIERIIQIDDINKYLESGSLKRVSSLLLERLQKLTQIINGYRCSFEYIQDYLSINGLLMCQEELRNTIRASIEPASLAMIEVATNLSLKGATNRPCDSRPLQQLEFERLFEPALTTYGSQEIRRSFMVRLIEIILEITDPRLTIYDEQTSAWYEQKSPHDQVVDLKVFELTASGLGVAGLNGLDRLCCCLLMLELRKLDLYLVAVQSGRYGQDLVTLLRSIQKLRQEVSSFGSDNTGRHKSTATGRLYSGALVKLAPHSDKLTDHLLRIGQLQAIRNNITLILSTKCRREARNLYNCLETLNTTLLSSLKDLRHSFSSTDLSQTADVNKSRLTDNLLNQQDCTHNPSSSSEEIGSKNGIMNKSNAFHESDQMDSSQLVFDLARYLEWIGLSDPITKLYKYPLESGGRSEADDEEDANVSIELIFLLILNCCAKLQFSRATNGFIPKQHKTFYESQPTIDAQPFFYGLTTLLNHYEQQYSVDEGPLDGDTSAIRVACPVERVLQLLGVYIRISLNEFEGSIGDLRLKDLNLRVGNAILSATELLRLSRRRPDELLSDTLLPNYFVDSFQFASATV